jgi:hypothetical protein
MPANADIAYGQKWAITTRHAKQAAVSMWSTVQHRRKLPGQVVGVLDAGVHAKAASRRKAVSRIASKKHVALHSAMVETLEQSQSP